MQRRIVLMRHGHAQEGQDDYERRLSEAGREAARRAGAALVKSGQVPDHVLTSTAPRALHTAELVAEACAYVGSIQGERALYLANELQLLAALQRLPAGVRHVLLVAHNPGLSVLAHQLLQHSRELRPAESASAEFDLDDWSELG
jgi:phosphohistidine phosphatase